MNVKVRYFYDLVTVLTKKEIKIRYKNSFFGYLWSLANPLCFALIYYTAFKVFMRVDIENYTLFLICGLFPWQWISGSIQNNLYVYLANAQIIKKTNFPRSVLPLSNILMEGFNFIVSIPVIMCFIIFYDENLHVQQYMIWIPLLGIITIIMTYGFSLMFATLNLFFRDIERFVSLVIMMLFYATPILYSVDMIPSSHEYIIRYNPLAKIILLWRELFLTGEVNKSYLLDCVMIGLVSSGIAILTFNKLKYKFAEVL